MQCDGDHACKNMPNRAPRLIVPHKFRFGEPMLKPRRMMTLMHFCEPHRVVILMNVEKFIEGLLTAGVKADFEKIAKLKWPHGYTCDFERASVEWVLVTTPEYRTFMAGMGYEGVMGAASLAPEQQRFVRERMGVMKVAGDA